MILDSNGNEIGYIPFVLGEGEETAPITLEAIPGTSSDILTAGFSEFAELLGRLAGVGAYQNLTSFPIALAPYYPGSVLIQVKAKAAISVPGATRVYMSLTTSKMLPALWLI